MSFRYALVYLSSTGFEKLSLKYHNTEKALFLASVFENVSSNERYAQIIYFC